MIRFSLSSVPSTFPLAHARLHLYAFEEQKSELRIPHVIYAARVLKRWREGNVPDRDGRHDGKNVVPQQGSVTGNSAQHGLRAWEKPGATGATDVADSESSATVGINWPEWVALDVTESVRYFLENPDENFGWKISQDPDHGVDDDTIEYTAGVHTYSSSEAPDVHLRPILVLVPAPAGP